MHVADDTCLTLNPLALACLDVCICRRYAITSLDIFNLTMVVPLTALNVIFLAWNAKLVYDNDKNGSSRIISSMV